MMNHFEGIYNQDVLSSVRLPNSIFKTLSKCIRNKNGSTNIQQVAFGYSYLVAVAFLYKYTYFVDLDNQTYVQNKDIKELLGYSRDTKTIDRVIKKDGLLDKLHLTLTTREYPVRYTIDKEETINKIPLREFVLISELKSDDINYAKFKKIIKNKNYVVKEPLFLTSGYEGSEYGTLYSIERTHKITIKEFLTFLRSDDFNNIEFLIYGFLKSRCFGRKNNMYSVPIYKIISEVGIDRSTFYTYLENLKRKNYIKVIHKEWKTKGDNFKKMEANDYIWLGV